MERSAENYIFLLLHKPRAVWAVLIHESPSSQGGRGLKNNIPGWEEIVAFMIHWDICSGSSAVRLIFYNVSEVKMLWNGLEYSKSCLLHCRFEAVFASIYWAK